MTPSRVSQLGSTSGGDNMDKMAKMKMTTLAFLGQNSGGRGGQANFLGGGGGGGGGGDSPQSPPLGQTLSRDLRNICTTRNSCRDASFPSVTMVLKLPLYFYLLMFQFRSPYHQKTPIPISPR